MKNIVLTTLFAGCFAVSAAVAGDSCKNCGIKFTAKATTGIAFAGKVKTSGLTHNGEEITCVTYGTSGGMKDGVATPNKSANKNTKKKSSAFIGVNLGMKYGFNDMISLGGEIFYDAMNVKFQLKENVKGLDDTAKIRGRYGMMVVLGWTPMEKMSFDFGIGIAKTTKIKDLHVVDPQDPDEDDIKDTNNVKFKNSFGLILKAGANYAFNENLSLGLDVTMQKVKAKNKRYTDINKKTYSAGELAKFKCNLYTIGATLTYTF